MVCIMVRGVRNVEKNTIKRRTSGEINNKREKQRKEEVKGGEDKEMQKKREKRIKIC